ncbi:4-methylaminobutanoate oxidase (formaldehyde-forming) [Paraburkholderia graminis C4D1M]|jgi:sarcosine oxidase subunit beta|uniref:FAD dependent oxidoreductase n=2 Tax=Paraburkholderia graminis TaxID=60548 RepID=B1FZQ9_PARG4|nr:FAD-binding oxidoreductase [Paraburkholderia graminis]EDT10424.1 FAD dependent oxidoreductase [Paraburkholderia graminis C4D1M]MDQ0624569.1 sarcosine oxidase subunit beta [Paraburkholderia graminis]MDR6205726.1 sarcosine oxidase subunit beta [Paraburkholderia graminis]MDR6475226.1 sarcosine oxidase subunit beta [Paraburkholderia graminis]CAB3736014.1 4-methylaminobutanoate oxidase (formaldehyde-forming) [Paraburkholderia graminis C4D1M]
MSATRNEADVIVIGGGIMGTTTTFFLRRRNRSVILLERGLTGQQASGVNFGGVRRQGRALPQLAMANRALRTWQRSAELLGEDVEFLPVGHTRVCYHQKDVENFDQYAIDARAYGLELEVLHGDALFRRFPFLSREVLAASSSPLDGHANPRLAAPAFGRAAARLGAQVIENTEIVRVEKEGDRFRVESARGDVYRAAQLVICAGAWATRLTEQFGESAPLVVSGPQMCVTEPVPYVFKSSMGVFTSIKQEGIYFRQIPRGNIIVGGGPAGPADAATSRASVLPQNTVRQLAQMRRLVPALAPLHVIRVWSGVESYLPDSEPVIGPSSKVDGLFYAFGFSGSGFQIGPGVGETMAELVDTGSTPIPLDRFSIQRFAKEPIATS